MKTDNHSYLTHQSGFCGADKRLRDGELPASENKHLRDMNERMTKISREAFAKTPAEKEMLKIRTSQYPNKRHRPVKW